MFSRLSRFCAAATLATLLFTPYVSASKPTGWPFGNEYKNRGKKKDTTNNTVPATPETIQTAPSVAGDNDAALPVKRTNEDPSSPVREKSDKNLK